VRSDEAFSRCIGRHTVPVAKALHLSVSTVSKWKEPTLDFSESGALNPLDRIETTIRTALSSGQPEADAYAPVEYLAAQFGLMVIPLPKDVPTLNGLVQAAHCSMKEFGEFIASFSEAIEDGKITPPEHRRMDKEGIEVIQRILAVMQLLDHGAGQSYENHRV